MKETIEIWLNSDYALAVVVAICASCFITLILAVWRIVKENKIIKLVKKNPNIYKLTIGRKGEIHVEKNDTKSHLKFINKNLSKVSKKQEFE
ncbi:MAG: hypothetical protein AAGF96_01200 [Bacteroidota bacterium]